MKIFNVIRALLPHIDKDKVLEDLRVTSGELEKFAIPSYKHADAYFKTNKLKSQSSLELSDIFYRNFDLHGGLKSSSFIGEIANRLVLIKDNVDYLLKISEDLYEKDIINEGLTVKKAIILRAAGNVSYISRYSINLLNLVYVNETVNANAQLLETMELAPAAIESIIKNIAIFARMVSDYGIPNKKFMSIVLNTPDVILSSKTESSVNGLYNEKDIDPFTNSFKSGFTGSPIFHTRMIIAEWQTNRYKTNKDKAKVLELRLLYLKTMAESQPSPQLEREIEYIQNRIDKLDRYLYDVERELELN